MYMHTGCCSVARACSAPSAWLSCLCVCRGLTQSKACAKANCSSMRWHRLKPAMLAAPAGSDFVARTNPPMVEAWACPTVAACCHTVAGSSRLLWRQPRAALVAKVHVVALRNFSQLEISFQQTASHHSSNNKASFNLCIGAIGSLTARAMALPARTTSTPGCTPARYSSNLLQLVANANTAFTAGP